MRFDCAFEGGESACRSQRNVVGCTRCTRSINQTDSQPPAVELGDSARIEALALAAELM